MSVLVEMKVAGWSWALLPKAPHSFWSYQQKSLLFQQWFPWQCSQSRKEGGRKKKSQWHFKCKLYWKKKMFSSEENTRSLSMAEATAAEHRTRAPHRGRGHYQMTPCSNPEPSGRTMKSEASTEEPLQPERTRVRWTGARTVASTILLAHTPWEGPKLTATHRLLPYQYFV